MVSLFFSPPRHGITGGGELPTGRARKVALSGSITQFATAEPVWYL